MRPGGVEVPINGDIVVFHEGGEAGDRYVVRTFPDHSHGEAFATHDEAVIAATAIAASAQVSVFYCEMPNQPTLLKPFRTL